MAVTATTYTTARLAALFWSGAIKVMLTTGTYVPVVAHAFKSEVTGEVVDASYPAGGVALPNKRQTADPSTGVVVLDCDDIVFPDLTAPAIRYAVFYADTGVAATSPVLLWWDLGEEASSLTAPFTLALPSTGLLTISPT